MVGAPLGGVWGIQWGGAGTSRRGGPGLRGGHWNPWNIRQLYSQVWGVGLPWGVAGKGLASLWVSEVQDPRSLLSLLSLPLPEWISIDKDEAGAKSKAPSVSRGSQDPR